MEYLELTSYIACSGARHKDAHPCSIYRLIAEVAQFNDRITFYYCLN